MARRDSLATCLTVAAVSTAGLAVPEADGRDGRVPGAAPPPMPGTIRAAATAAAVAGAATRLTRVASVRRARRRFRPASRSGPGSTVASSRRSWARSSSASWSSVSMENLLRAAVTGRGDVGKGDAETGQGTGGVGLHRPLGDTEQLSGLGDGQVLKEPQHHDLALAGRQAHQRLDNRAPLADLVSELVGR